MYTISHVLPPPAPLLPPSSPTPRKKKSSHARGKSYPLIAYFILQKPKEIRVGGPIYNPCFAGNKQEFVPTFDTYQYVPLLKSLRALLADSSVMEEINNFPQRVRDEDTLETFCDGELFKTHPLFLLDLMALQIIACGMIANKAL